MLFRVQITMFIIINLNNVYFVSSTFFLEILFYILEIFSEVIWSLLIEKLLQTDSSHTSLSPVTNQRSLVSIPQTSVGALHQFN
jgi:hypothetical protein